MSKTIDLSQIGKVFFTNNKRHEEPIKKIMYNNNIVWASEVRIYFVEQNEMGNDDIIWDSTAEYEKPFGNIFPPNPRVDEFCRIEYWYDDKDYEKKPITSDMICTYLEDLVLRAMIVLDEYKVNFDSQGGSSCQTKKVVYKKSYGFLEKPTKRYCDFDGWYTSSGQLITQDTICNTNYEHTLYAKWKAKLINIYLMRVDDIGNEVLYSQTTTRYGNPYGNLVTPTAEFEYMRFLGWFTNSGNKITADMICYEEFDISLYPRWELDVYTVYFDTQGGGYYPPSTVTYTQGYTLPSNPTKTGHTFVGWYTAPNGGSEIKWNTACSIRSDHTLYAKWILKQIWVHFMGYDDVGNEVPIYSQIATYGQAYGTLYTPSSQYAYERFIGWYTYWGQQVTSSMICYEENSISLYARWEIERYTVYFDSQGGGYYPPSTVTYTQGYSLPSNLTKTGYTFAGWYTAPNGGSEIKWNTACSIRSDHTLYARWSPKQIWVHFMGYDDVGNEVPIYSQIATYGQTYGNLYTLDDTIYERFAGWYTYWGQQVTSSMICYEENSISLYARWEEKINLITHAPQISATMYKSLPYYFTCSIYNPNPFSVTVQVRATGVSTVMNRLVNAYSWQSIPTTYVYSTYTTITAQFSKEGYTNSNTTSVYLEVPGVPDDTSTTT